MIQVTKGKITGTAKRVVIYGPEGVGKSSLANAIPRNVFIDTEDGTKELDVQGRILALDWRAIEAAVRDLTADPQGFSCVTIDTADWCEKAMIEGMLARSGKKSIEDYGYGKGYKAAEEEFARFLASLDGLIAKGIHVVFVAHSKIKRFSAPDQTDGYDRYQMKLTDKTADLVKEWADMILFCKIKVQIVEGTDGKLKGQGTDLHVIYTNPSPAWDAKNRYGLPEEIPFVMEALPPPIAAIFEGNAARAVTPPPVTQKPVTPPVVQKQLTAKQAESVKTPEPANPTPETADHLPGLVDPVVKVPDNITAWLDANAAAINAYLIRVSWLPAGKTWRDLPAEKLTLVVEKPAKFARAAGVPALAE